MECLSLWAGGKELNDLIIIAFHSAILKHFVVRKLSASFQWRQEYS